MSFKGFSFIQTLFSCPLYDDVLLYGPCDEEMMSVIPCSSILNSYGILNWIDIIYNNLFYMQGYTCMLCCD